MLFKKKKNTEEQTKTIAIESLENVEEDDEYEYVDEDDDEYEYIDEDEEEYYRQSRKKGIRILLIILACLILLVGGLGGYFILFPKMRYNKAIKYIEQENYEYALNSLNKKPAYKENRTLIVQCQQNIANRAAEYIVSVDDVCKDYKLTLNGATLENIEASSKNSEVVTVIVNMSNELFSYVSTYDVDYHYENGSWIADGANKTEGILSPLKECDDSLVTKALKKESFVHTSIDEKQMVDALSLQYDLTAYKHTSATKRTQYLVRVICTYDITTGEWSVGEINSQKEKEENEIYEQKISSQGLAVEVPESWTTKDSTKKIKDPETGDTIVIHVFSLYYKKKCMLTISDDIYSYSFKKKLEFGNVYVLSNSSSGASGYVLTKKNGEPEYYYSTTGLSASEIKKIMKTFASRY